MKITKTKNLPILTISLVILASASVSFAQNYNISWFKIAGGGGTSTNGQYSLNCTIGQHDAGGPMTNGQYSLIGGFWVLPTAVQTPGAPTLKIVTATAGQVTI